MHTCIHAYMHTYTHTYISFAFAFDGTASGLEAAYQSMHIMKCLRSSNTGCMYSAGIEITGLGPTAPLGRAQETYPTDPASKNPSS